MFKGDEELAKSIAWGGSVDGLNGRNVEHLHFPIPDDDTGYKLQVRLRGSGAGSFPYAIAWWYGT